MLLLHALKAHLEVIPPHVPIPQAAVAMVVEAMAEEAVASAEEAVDLAVAEDVNFNLPIQYILL